MSDNIQWYEGPRGPQGPQGPRGERGPQGERGNDGYNGTKGARGPQGEKGEKGEQGIQGIAGPMGPQGPRGEKGDKGDNGADGGIGPTGPMGEQGPRGERGPQGPVGPRGVQGLKGERGERGEQGPQGIQGEKGDQGERGDMDPLDVEDIDNINLASGLYKTKTTTQGTFPFEYRHDIVNRIGSLEVIRLEGDYVTQEWNSVAESTDPNFRKVTPDSTFTRVHFKGQWTEWKKLITRHDAMTVSNAYLENLDNFAPISGAVAKFRNTTLNKPNGCEWGTVMFTTENEGSNALMAQAGTQLLMCNNGVNKGKVFIRIRNNNAWEQLPGTDAKGWRELGAQEIRAFNHPTGDRVRRANDLNVNGYVLTDENTTDLPNESGHQLDDESKKGILKFVMESDPKTKAGPKSGTQMYTSVYGPQGGSTYTRTKNNGRWNKWQRLATNEDLDRHENEFMLFRDQMNTILATHDLKYATKYENSPSNGQHGGLLKLGVYGMQWINDIPITMSPKTITFDRLIDGETYTVWYSIRGVADMVVPAVGFRELAHGSNAYEFFARHAKGNVYVNIFAIGRLRP